RIKLSKQKPPPKWAEFKSEKPDKNKTPKNWHQQNHVPTRGAETRPKNNNKNKTTKHTIEFSNNTLEQATLPLYSAA
ncbi:MAG TPA: hypothetical protein VMC78_22590, partial [Mycobacterium sp.]|nr:hypothetical protein [Mycobacterium sp.]